MEEWHKKLSRHEESLREEGRQERTREVVNMLRRVTPNSQVPWKHVDSGLDIADWLESTYLFADGQEGDDA